MTHTMFITWIMSLIVCENFCLTALKNKFPQIFKILWQLYSHYLKYITAELLRSKLKFLTRGPLRLPLTAPALSRDGRLGTMGVVSWLPPRPLPTTPLSTLLWRLFSTVQCSALFCAVLLLRGIIYSDYTGPSVGIIPARPVNAALPVISPQIPL